MIVLPLFSLFAVYNSMKSLSISPRIRPDSTKTLKRAQMDLGPRRLSFLP